MELKIATFGAGCFWGVEEAFRKIPGVIETVVGYASGHIENPDYRRVCQDNTGHAEVVQVTFDPAQVTYQQLLDVFWKVHDPTQLNRQGPDVGTQYRSIILYHSKEQKEEAEYSKQNLQQSRAYNRPIVTEIAPITPFYRAEEYHQKYLFKRHMAACHVNKEPHE